MLTKCFTRDYCSSPKRRVLIKSPSSSIYSS